MKTNKVKIKRFVLTNIPYFIVAYAGNLMCFAFRTAEGETVSDKIIPAIENIGPALAHILPSMNLYDIIIGAAAGGVTKAVMKIREADRKKFRHGTEYGSAVWGSSRDIEPYMDTNDIENNIELLNIETYKLEIGDTKEYFPNQRTMDFNELNRIEKSMFDIYTKMKKHKELLTRLSFRLGNQKGLKV